MCSSALCTPEHKASARTSENPVQGKFAERPFQRLSGKSRRALKRGYTGHHREEVVLSPLQVSDLTSWRFSDELSDSLS
jgi:hypothetical protein